MADRHDERKTARTPTGRLQRMVKLSSTATGVAARLATERLVEKLLPRDQRDARRHRALTRSGEQLVDVMGQLKGAAMKVGQMLSQGLGDFPTEVAQVLSRLQDAAPPMDFPTVSAQIEAAFDLPIHELFRYFDWRPVASASIGQVHRAELPDGTPVAVKVQYPGVAASLDADLDNLRMLLRLGRVVLTSAAAQDYDREVRAVLRAELDYEREARTIDRFRAVYAGARDDRGGATAAGDAAPGQPGFDLRVRVPRVYHEYTRPTVLTMEYVRGEKLDAWLERTPDPAERHRVAMLLFEVFARMFHELHLLHADPHPGNYLLGPDGELVLLDYGCVRDFRPEFTDESLRLIQDLRRGRREALPERFRALGFHNVERFEAAQLDELSRMILAPYLAEGEFPMGRWDIQAQLQRHLQRHLSLVHLQPPGEAIFFFRTCAGLLGHMRRLDACGDFAATISEIMRRRGIDP